MQPRPDEHSVLAVEAAYDAAWNEGDVDDLVRCFTEDAVLVNPHGEVAVGAASIRDRLDSAPVHRHPGPA